MITESDIFLNVRFSVSRMTPGNAGGKITGMTADRNLKVIPVRK